MKCQHAIATCNFEFYCIVSVLYGTILSLFLHLNRPRDKEKMKNPQNLTSRLIECNEMPTCRQLAIYRTMLFLRSFSFLVTCHNIPWLDSHKFAGPTIYKLF